MAGRAEPLIGRVSAVEAGLSALTRDVSELSAAVKKQGEVYQLAFERQGATSAVQMEKLADNSRKQLAELYDRVSNMGRTNWGTLAAWAGILVLLCGGMLSYVHLNLTPMQLEYQRHREDSKITHDAIDEHFVRLDARQEASIKERAVLETRFEAVKTQLEWMVKMTTTLDEHKREELSLRAQLRDKADENLQRQVDDLKARVCPIK